MLYNITWHMLYNIKWHMLYNITWHMLYIILRSGLFCSVRTSSLADIQALVFLLIHSQNVNWITRAQINPRREKMQISFYINQFHLWNNSRFLERICFFPFLFCTRFFICIFIFFYLTYKTRQNFNFSFYPFPHLFMPNQFFDKKKGQELKQNNWKYLRNRSRTRVTKISRISWMRHFPVNCFFLQWRAIFFPSWPG